MYNENVVINAIWMYIQKKPGIRTVRVRIRRPKSKRITVNFNQSDFVIFVATFIIWNSLQHDHDPVGVNT